MGRPPTPYWVRLRYFEALAWGLSSSGAARAVGVAESTVRPWVAQGAPVGVKLLSVKPGGLEPVARVDPPTGQPVRRALTSEDRAVIAACVKQRRDAGPGGQRLSLAQIGALIGRDKSVISREIARHTGPDGSYYAPLAHRAAAVARRRPKTFRLIENPGLCRRIETWMDDGWSPRLIAETLRSDHPGSTPTARVNRVSHETIYQALYVQTRGGLRHDLHRQLSTRRAARRPQAGSRRDHSPYREAFTIRQRPAEVEDRAVPGHWEGDLIIGAGGTSAVGTLVERTTRFVMLLHLPGRHDSHSVAEAMIAEMGRLPEHLRKSLTYDRGTELAQYAKIQLELKMPVYFCDPHSPWQRGSNENTNRLLRHWLEKGSDLSGFTAEDLRIIASKLNARPRPTLDYKTPAQALDELLAQPPAA